MNPDHAVALLTQFLGATLTVVAPILMACLVGGVVVGILQTATQINEASISYVAKASLLIGLLLVAGGAMTDKLVAYTRASFSSVAEVAR